MSDPKETKAPEAKAALAPAPAAKAPTVEVTPALQPGQKVKHANGATYTVAEIFPSGVKLVGVANLVDAKSLSLI